MYAGCSPCAIDGSEFEDVACHGCDSCCDMGSGVLVMGNKTAAHVKNTARALDTVQQRAATCSHVWTQWLHVHKRPTAGAGATGRRSKYEPANLFNG